VCVLALLREFLIIESKLDNDVSGFEKDRRDR